VSINIQITTNSLVNIFIYMAASFDTNLWSSSGHYTRLETHTDSKSISWRFPSFT